MFAIKYNPHLIVYGQVNPIFMVIHIVLFKEYS